MAATRIKKVFLGGQGTALYADFWNVTLASGAVTMATGFTVVNNIAGLNVVSTATNAETFAFSVSDGVVTIKSSAAASTVNLKPIVFGY